MCQGIAVIVYEKDGKLQGIATGISSHDELCKTVEELRYGKIEPYRFELLYPCNLTFDRAYNYKGECGLFKEQPKKEIWDIAFETAKNFFMMHNRTQLEKAYLSEANLSRADLSEANLSEANLTGAYYDSTTKFTEDLDKSKMIKLD